jgi:hypothetical protein
VVVYFELDYHCRYRAAGGLGGRKVTGRRSSEYSPVVKVLVWIGVYALVWSVVVGLGVAAFWLFRE